MLNPARVRGVARVAARCTAAATAAGWDWLLAETTIDDPGTGLARQAVSAGARLVFAVGGDGTVRACAQALAGTAVPLAIVPRGTANLAARALGVPARLDAALACGLRGHERRIDLATADGITFVAMAGDWDDETNNWLRWARTPGFDAYWHYRDAFLDSVLPPPWRANARSRLRRRPRGA